MANFVHFSNVNSLFKKKNEQVWQSRNQAKLASPTMVSNSSFTLKPKRRLSLKLLISVIIFALLLVGGVSAMVLSQMQQDVRQQASGCTYWNGEAATEGSYDNRGGIRQQCVGGLWTLPDDGNVDPSQIIAEQNANKPQRGCRNWDGTEVAAGAYDNRGGIRQQCVDGLWSHPDDGITDPNDTSSLALVATLKDVAEGDAEYEDARAVYDQYCRSNVDSTDTDRCKSLSNKLTNMEQDIRYTALNDTVVGNTGAVNSALGGLNDRSVDFNEARSVYREYCQGAKAQQTSSSACNSLKSELDEIEALVNQAETAKWTAINDAVTNNTEQVSYAIGGLDERTMDFNEARSVYREYCQGAKAQQTSSSACNSLKSELDEIEALVNQAETAKWTAINDTVVTNTNSVNYAVNAINSGVMDVEAAQISYDQYCVGAAAQKTSSSACQNLQAAINEEKTSSAAGWNALNERVASNTSTVNTITEGLNSGNIRLEVARENYQRLCVGGGANYTSVSSCQNLQAAIDDVAAEQAYIKKWTTIENMVQTNTTTTNEASANILTNSEQANEIYQEYCEGPNAQMTGGSSCDYLSNLIGANNTYQNAVATGTLACIEGQYCGYNVVSGAPDFSGSSSTCNGKNAEGNSITVNSGDVIVGSDGLHYECLPSGSWNTVYLSYDYPVVSSNADLENIALVSEIEQDHQNINIEFDYAGGVNSAQILLVQEQLNTLNSDLFSQIDVDVYLYSAASQQDICDTADDPANTITGGCAWGEGQIAISDESLLFSGESVLTHEMIHAADSLVIESEYCPSGNSCTILEAYIGVAELDGIVLYTEDNPVGDSYRDSTVESLAWECSEYNARPEMLDDTPNVKEFCSMFFEN
ncbi:hypothetical protein KJZ63_02570 [Patescibacteria group bacterium]|nr:hypothetical protein [Patescibacteria group bacterium]